MDSLADGTVLHPVSAVVGDSPAFDLDHGDAGARESDDEVAFMVTIGIGEAHVGRQQIVALDAGFQGIPDISLTGCRELRIGWKKGDRSPRSHWSSERGILPGQLAGACASVLHRKSVFRAVSNESPIRRLCLT